MARPIIDSSNGAIFSFTFNGSITISHTVAGTNRILIVGVETVTNSLSGVTYGGVALTQKTSQANGSQTSYIYYLLAPTVGTANVVASFSGFGSCGAHTVSWTGVDQTINIGTPSTSVASGTISQTVTTTVDDMVQDVLGKSGQIGLPAAGSGQTEIANGRESANTSALAASYKNGAAGTTTMVWTGGGGTNSWIGIPIRGLPDPSAAPDVYYFRLSIYRRVTKNLFIQMKRRFSRFIDRIRPFNLER